MRFVFTYGVFDLLHGGHVDFLKEAKGLGDYLVVALVEDETVREVKGEGRPVYDTTHRKKLVSSMKCVDEVLTIPTYGIFEALKTFMDGMKDGDSIIVVKGDDMFQVELGKLDEIGVKFVPIPYHEGYSTSDTIKKILEEE